MTSRYVGTITTTIRKGNGYETVMVEVTVDPEKLVEARRTHLDQNITKIGHGSVVLTVVSRETVPPDWTDQVTRPNGEK